MRDDQTKSQHRINKMLKERYKELGPITWQEYVIALLLITMVTLWLTRDFSSFRGWDAIFRKK